MDRCRIETIFCHELCDTISPVLGYLRVRGKYKNPILLESGDYRGAENSVSYLCADPIATLRMKDGIANEAFLSDEKKTARTDGLIFLHEFYQQVHFIEPTPASYLFGFTGYSSVRYFEDIQIDSPQGREGEIPDLSYSIYRYVVQMSHFQQKMTIYRNILPHEPREKAQEELLQFQNCLQNGLIPSSDFHREGEAGSNLTHEEHVSIIEHCKSHVARGDVFQIVPSRKFSQNFYGDDFLVYRCLRSINPTPFLFYFDFGDFRLFGSSPELQISVHDGRASIHPIAGTYPRSTDRTGDQKLAEELLCDPKESSEHVMLVDLARNDLSRHCTSVRVENFKEVEFYSHVIHLVSKVTGALMEGSDPLQVFADTFPAGTLSGAPKYRAMELIHRYEPQPRSFYGGAIGFFTPEKNITHAILIRSFLSKDNTLFFQSGCGVVTDSVPELEVQEVENKLKALSRAIEMAESLNEEAK